MNDKLKFDIDESKIKVNPLLDGAIRSKIRELESFVNTADLNHNGVPDIQELGIFLDKADPFIREALPVLASVSAAIDFEKLAEEAVNAPWVKDKAAALEIVQKAGSLAEKAGKLVEALNAAVVKK